MAKEGGVDVVLPWKNSPKEEIFRQDKKGAEGDLANPPRYRVYIMTIENWPGKKKKKKEGKLGTSISGGKKAGGNLVRLRPEGEKKK